MAKDQKSSPLFILVAMLTAVAALYFAREILLPVALAILLSFLLTPLTDRLERWRIPRVLAVLLVVAMAFGVIGGLGWIVTDQVVDLSQQLPIHKQNLIDKIKRLKPQSPTIARISEAFSDIHQEIVKTGKGNDATKPKSGDAAEAANNSRKDATAAAEKKDAGSPNRTESPAQELAESGKPLKPPSEREAVPVRVVELPRSPLESIQGWLGPLVAPFTTAGIVFVLMLFMLLDREGQRSRLIQLFGRSHFHTTTEAVHDVAIRVGRYLRSLFLVNAGYGAVITVGLLLIGVPNALMWGVLGFAMRFLPYLGPWIAASVPILISIATSSGWTQPLLVFGLYLLVELVVYNFIEPFVYGGVVGVSTVGILVTALFWTWLWGPIGLVLAMPMTVCLLVAARYIPQLRFLIILLADHPPLSPAERVYQRLLAFDYHEPLKLAEKHLKEHSLVSFYDDVLIPALRMAECDRQEETLNEEQATFVMEAAEDLVVELGDFSELKTGDGSAKHLTDGLHTPTPQSSAGTAPKARILCVPLLDDADEAASRMLAQLLLAEGFDVDMQGAKRLTSEVVDRVADSESDVVVISVLPPIGPRDTRLLWKRLRSRHPTLPIVVGYWTGTDKKDGLPTPDDDNMSRVATRLSEAVTLVRGMAAQQKLTAKTA
jgi:predicted PurR-regulated permease PerM/methylmalonyl-CoA mutase cobalamin-binding subunit